MKRTFIVVAVALVLVGCSSEASRERMTTPPASVGTALPQATIELEPAAAGADGAGDVLFPTAGNGGYDVQSYDITLTWDPTSGTIAETTKITAIATQALSRFNLDLVALDVASVQIDGDAAVFSRTAEELVIDPVEDLLEGSTFTTVIELSGVPSETESGGWVRGPNGGALALGEPDGAAGWFPVNDHPSDKAIYTLTVTAPSELTVASNGVLSDKVVDGAVTTWTYINAQPQASYLTALAIGDYQIVDGGTSASGVPIRNVFPADRVDELTAAFARQPQMIDAFEQRFGPYPFEVYGALVADGLDFQWALEIQTMSVFGAYVVGGGGGDDDWVIAHELAHQWFGDSVSLEQWNDIWLNEGFASYAEELWAEAQEPGLDLTQKIRDDLADASPRLVAALNEPLTAVTAEPGGLFTPAVYIRGSYLLHSLRLEIGDDDFLQLLQEWTATYRNANASTDDFIALAEVTSGEQLDDLFDRWLNATTMPDDFGPGG
jgi:aminopeptidase N